ncbi:MAG: hypothetical protein LJE68_13325 [Rhodobacter sp.]|nr:hypothetical protein [Rhodobacter sp.]
MTRLLLLGLLAFSLASCGLVRNTAGRIGIGSGSANRADVEIEGTRFRARANADGEDKRNFAVTVTPVAVNSDGAREAGR